MAGFTVAGFFIIILVSVFAWNVITAFDNIIDLSLIKLLNGSADSIKTWIQIALISTAIVAILLYLFCVNPSEIFGVTLGGCKTNKVKSA